jgi:hypothetical protein
METSVVELNPGKIICDKCNGRGEIVEPFSESHNSYDCDFITCPKCKGNKKVDWIENVVGVKETKFEAYLRSVEKIGNQVKVSWQSNVSFTDIANE